MSIIGMVIISLIVSGIVGPVAAMAGRRYERRRIEKLLLERAGWTGIDRARVHLDVTRDALATAPGGEARIDQLEQSIDAVALELERVGEGQRFLTKILRDRPKQES